MYSNVPNKRARTFISGKVCLLTLIEPKRQTLPEINAQGLLFGTLEYCSQKLGEDFAKFCGLLRIYEL